MEAEVGKIGQEVVRVVAPPQGLGEADAGHVEGFVGSGRLARATRPAKDGKAKLVVSRFLMPSARRALATRAIKSNERLVPVSFTRYRASTSGLSTWWSSTALQGELVLRLVSRLDAFSGYPFHI